MGVDVPFVMDEGPPYRAPLKRWPVWGWMSFDFAAQPFFTVVVTFVYGPFFVSQLASDPATGQTAWATIATIAGLLVAFGAPILGAIADRSGPRKPWIAGFALVKIAALLALWFVAPGSSLLLAGLLMVAAMCAAEFSIVFNDAMMPSLVARSSIGLVSNVAWGIGYLGGTLALVLTLAFLAAAPDTGTTLLGFHPLFGLDPATGEGARATAPLSALWYALFVLPMFLLVPDRPACSASRGRAVQDGLAELLGTWRELRQRRELFRFMIARLVYQDGVSGTLVLGGAFAAGLFGWTVVESGAFGMLLVVAAVIGNFAASLVDRRFGSRLVILLSVVLLGSAVIGIISTSPSSTLFGLLDFGEPGRTYGALFGTPAEKAYLVFGTMIGLAFGPIQASSRSWLAQSITAEEAGRYFGLFAFTGRATSFVAPLSVAVITALASGRTDPITASRIGMSALITFYVVGFAILLTTRDPRDRRPA